MIVLVLQLEPPGKDLNQCLSLSLARFAFISSNTGTLRTR